MAIERVNYFDQQFLRVQDFEDEQSYQIAMRRRHNISHHSWGIVHGLEPQFVAGALWLAPGLAVDGFGRELISDHIQPLPTKLFEDLQADELRVWISYSTRPVEEATGGYALCAETPRFYRLSEQVRIELLRSNPNSTPRKPASILETDEDFDATRTPPEDRNWPVFLGTVRANYGNPERPFSIDLAGRAYVGLVGEAVTAPSGGARVQVGAGDKADVNRFAVFVPATDPKPHLAVEQDGTLTVRGDTTLQGDVSVAGGALEIGVGPAAAPQPWRLYRVEQIDPTGAACSELRIEMQGGSGGDNQVVFGAWSPKENKFKPCLTISDDGTVTVAGNLVVHGKVDAKTGAVVTGDATAGELPPHMQKIRELAETISHSEAKHLHDFATVIKNDYKGVAEKLKQLL